MRRLPAGHPARLLAVALAAILAGSSTAGCDAFQEHVCGGGEYPVKQIGSATGRQCVPDDRDPPPGTVRYPAGKVPRTVGDKWDKRWSRTIFDANGNPVAQDPTLPPP
ncbi:SCO0607 family lipoprotein [Embleya sp. NPDC059237]|uniref:SCO0607 family lipoprotein n=1 Tax=Embleya sp. NPDC059237 TaxID=3346784 RepID=UPI0036AFFA6C